MLNKPSTFRKIPVLCAYALCWLTACSSGSNNEQPKNVSPIIAGEVRLAADSPKKAYVKTHVLSLSKRPLLQPLAGKLVYDETLTSRVNSPVAGRVINMPRILGTQVKSGDILLELDSPDVADAESAYAKAETNLILTRKTLNRQQELYDGKAIPLKDLEQAQDDFNTATSELQRAKDKLTNLHINTTQNDGRYPLRSSIAGVIVERNVNPGMEVRPDLDTPLFVISDIKKLTVLMEVYEVNISKIRVGQHLSVYVPAYPGEAFSATVQYIAQKLDEQTRTIQVRCEIPNTDGRLLPGMYASINVESEPGDDAIIIPLTAVFTEDEADYVFVEVDNNLYKQRPIEIGLRLKDKAVVTKGLQAGERLVTEGALMLRTEEEVETSANAQ